MHGDKGFEDSMQAMFDMQEEGKILHVGVSNVNADELQRAMKIGPDCERGKYVWTCTAGFCKGALWRNARRRRPASYL